MTPAFLTSPLPLSTRSTFVPRAGHATLSSACPHQTFRVTPCAKAADRPAAQLQNTRLADVLEKVPAPLRGSLLRLPEGAEFSDLGVRHTKIIATVGPSSCSSDQLLQLVAAGVEIFRLNMSHGDFDWHRQVIDEVRNINLNTPFVAGVMIDVGSFDSVRLGAFSRNPVLVEGDSFTLTVRHEAKYPEGVSEVSDDGFIDFIEVGDLLQCQAEGANVVELLVSELSDQDVICKVVSPGELRSRGSITVRGKSLNLSPRVEGEDLNMSIARAVLGCPPDHLEFAINQRVEYIALSFVESADQINAVKGLLEERAANIGIVAKVESSNALTNLESIVAAADAVMVARGDLGTTIHYEKVPYWQMQISAMCLRYGKPCIVSTHFLESMVLYPTPTRAEVTDMTEAVKQRVDALVLTAETASGRFPFKAVSTMHAVLLRMQRRLYEAGSRPMVNMDDIPTLVKDKSWWSSGVGDIAENIASCAADLANQQEAAAILVFTQKGLMASLTSRYRPKAPIFAFTATPVVRNKMNLLYGVRPFRFQFMDDPEETINEAIEMLKERKAVEEGDLVVVVADVLGGREVTTDHELQSAFAEVSKGQRYITASEVRSGLRLMSLKVSDKLEAQLGMRDVDIEDVDKESMLTNEQPKQLRADEAVGQYNFARFKELALSAKEIVHTLQLRHIA